MAAQKPVDRSWEVTLSRRGTEKVYTSVQVIASGLDEAMETALDHCGAEALDLEVTSVRRLPSGVITRNTRRAQRRGRAMREDGPKHTPGPLHRDPDPAPNGPSAIFDGRGVEVGQAWRPEDADLWVAAPSLLEILRDGMAGGADGMHRSNCRCSWHRAARSVLATVGS